MTSRDKNWILRPCLDSAHWIEEESNILVTGTFCVLTSDINHNPLDWRLFIDASKLSLKALLLRNGNTLPSVAVSHSVHNKESYGNMKILMEAINYDKFKWQICGDLKWLPCYLNYNKDSQNTELFISPSGISELDCATTKTDMAERSISIGRESLQVFFCTRGLGVLPDSTARG